jgi:acyl-CoA synthetase (AMP-forming)/AMP-acid ligase II
MSQRLTDQLRLMAEHLPDEVAWKDLGSGETLTFGEWDQRANRVAAGLVAHGVSAGDRIAIEIQSERSIDWVISYAAVHKAGAVAVPCNSRWVLAELRRVLSHAEVSVICTTPELFDRVAGLDVASVGLVLLCGLTDPAEAGFASPAPMVKVLGTGQFDSIEAGPVLIDVDDDAIADILYTSGTTGRPKGVVVRHSNASLIPNGLPTWNGSGWITSSPLFTFAGITAVYNPMKLGMTAMYLPRFDAARWMEAVAQERPSMAFLVPAMAELIVNHPAFDSADLSSIGLCAIGSAPLSVETQRRLQQRMPDAAVSNGYGMTEAGNAYTILPKEEFDRRAGSVGKPLAPTVFVIVDDDGRPLPPGQVGELIIRTPQRTREYYRDAEATASTWHPDGLHTGDLGYLDDDGYLYIVGRTKDVVIRGGNNIYAFDVEAVIEGHPDIEQVAVAGIPHPVLGEDIAAWVVLRPGSALTPDELRDWLSGHLADYKVPRTITVVEDLPRNATGKVVKPELVAMLVAHRAAPEP